MTNPLNSVSNGFPLKTAETVLVRHNSLPAGVPESGLSSLYLLNSALGYKSVKMRHIWCSKDRTISSIRSLGANEFEILGGK